VAIEPIRWTFFNPKIGVRHERFYFSAGVSRREPTRTDLFQGEDNATFAHDLHAVHPERLLDLEAGWDYHTARGSISADVYSMNFRNEIAATGELSEIGLPLRRNVDRSFRRGIEVNGSWQIASTLRLRGNANVSRNRIHQWTQFYDVYDAAGNIVASRPLTFFNVRPLLTPELILNNAIEYTPSSNLALKTVARYIGKSHLDNTNNDAFTTPSVFVVDANASFNVSRSTQVMVQVNNLFNRQHVFPSGYSYQFFTPAGTTEGISYFYPQATRNAVVTLHVSL
jgi:iron complex outermembrane receptor protein